MVGSGGGLRVATGGSNGCYGGDFVVFSVFDGVESWRFFFIL